MRILHCIPSTNSEAGGPIEGVQQLGAVLSRRGHDIEVASLDAPNSPWLREFPFQVHALGPGAGKYGYSPHFTPWLIAHAAEYDAVVVNGIWQYTAFGAWRAMRKVGHPYVVYPHGMLDPWFKRQYPLKHLKKWLYWPWADYRVLRDAAAVLFTTDQERVDARESFWLYRCNEKVVNYGTKSPPEYTNAMRAEFAVALPDLGENRYILFLGRIHEKKGCDLLIRAFAQLSGELPRHHLVIAGPDQVGWLKSLKELAQQSRAAKRIHFPGMLRGNAKWGAMYGADAFALPSHQENFGIAVAEAAACGLPLLISDKVNIYRELSADGAAVVEDDTFEGTLRLLRTFAGMTPEKVAAMRASARQSFERRFEIEAAASSLASTLESLRHARRN